MIGGIIDAVINAGTTQRDYKRNVHQWEQSHQLAKRQFEEGIQTRVKDLKRAGLHPSLAAGMSQGSVASIPGQVSSKRTNFSRIGQAIEERKMNQANRELIEAQTENVKAQTEDIRKTTPIKGQVSTVHDQQADGTKSLIEEGLSQMEKATAEKTRYKQQLSADASHFWSPAEMAEARVRYGDEPVEWFMGLPNMLRNVVYKQFVKYGKGRSFTEFMVDKFHGQKKRKYRTRGQIKRNR